MMGLSSNTVSKQKVIQYKSSFLGPKDKIHAYVFSFRGNESMIRGILHVYRSVAYFADS